MRYVLGLAIGLFPWLVGASSMAATSPSDALLQAWPSRESVGQIRGQAVSFPSASPFTLDDVKDATGTQGGIATAQAAEPHQADGQLFMPAAASAAAPVPAVVLLHGARGISQAREVTYARQFAEMGIAALVIDVFSSRRDLATSFTERLIEITEAMAMADAFAALRLFRDRPEVDERRVALIGFSYGGMATLYAAHEQIAEPYARLFGLGDLRFAAHAAYYAPCIATFEDTRATGAPVLMQWGGADELIDDARCRETAEGLRSGGAEVETIVYPEAHHQWDGSLSRPWRAPRGLVDCDFLVTESGVIRGRMPGTPFYLAMTDPLSRKILLGLCSDSDGYLVARNEAVRQRSNAALGRFLAAAFR